MASGGVQPVSPVSGRSTWWRLLAGLEFLLGALLGWWVAGGYRVITEAIQFFSWMAGMVVICLIKPGLERWARRSKGVALSWRAEVGFWTAGVLAGIGLALLL